MKMKKRRNHDAGFKSRVVPETLKRDRRVSDLPAVWAAGRTA